MSKDISLETDQKNEIKSRHIFLNILGECLDKLAILRHIIGWNKDDYTDLEYKTIEERSRELKSYHGSSQESGTVPENFIRDCSFIERTIQMTYDEIREKGTFTTLTRVVETYEKLQNDESALFKDTEEKKRDYLDLQKTFIKEQDDFGKAIDDVMRSIGKVKDDIEMLQQEIYIKSRYINNRQKAKAAMIEYELMKTNEELENNVKAIQHDFVKEERVHQEIVNIYRELDMDLKKELEQWKVKYGKDYMEMEAKIKDLREKKDKQLEKTAELIKTYTSRQKEIDAFKEYKINQEQKRKEKEQKDNAATVLQAWWRGIMVRKGFGKYKKKRDKKGKKKSPSDKKK